MKKDRIKSTPSALIGASIAVVTLQMALATGAIADTVTLLNGDSITGTVTTISGGNVMLSTEHIGDLVIPAGQLTSITKEGMMRITTTSGAQLVGGLSNIDGQQVITTDSGTQAVAIADLFEAAEDNVLAVAPEPTWTTTADLGWSLTKGNSDTESRSIHVDSIATRGKFEHRAFAYLDSEEAQEVTTRETIDAGYDLRYYFRDKWYALGSIGYFRDELKEIDSRYTLGAGLGYQFFDHAIASLSTDLGATMVVEDLAGESETNPALRWGVDYFRWLRPGLVEYFYGHEVLKILDSERGEVYKLNTGIRFHVSERWHANARLDLVHETKPPAGNHKSDITYSVGFGMNF